MNSKMEVLIEAHGYKGSHPQENYTFSNFVKSFVKDYGYFGESTAVLYQALYGLDEESVTFLQKQIPLLLEMIKSSNTPFLFEERGGDAWQSSGAVRDINKSLERATRGRTEQPLHIEATPEAIEKPEILALSTTKIPALDPEALPKVPPTTYVAAAKAATPQEALATLAKGNGIKVQGSAAAAIVPGVTPKAGILSVLGGIWNKIKAFFGGGVKAIGDTIRTGNYANLIHIPLVQGALAAGGVALAVALLRKIFGKKKINPQKFNAAVQARQKPAAA